MKGLLRSIGSASVLAGIGLVVLGEFGVGAVSPAAKSSQSGGWCSKVNDGPGWQDLYPEQYLQGDYFDIYGNCASRGEYTPAAGTYVLGGSNPTSYPFSLNETISIVYPKLGVTKPATSPIWFPRLSWHLYYVNDDTTADKSDGCTTTSIDDGSCTVTEQELLTDDHGAVTKTEVSVPSVSFVIPKGQQGGKWTPKRSFDFTISKPGYYIYVLGTCVYNPKGSTDACAKKGSWHPITAGAIRLAATSNTPNTPTPTPTPTASPKLPVTHGSPSPTAKVAGAQAAASTPDTGTGSYGPSLAWGLALIGLGLGCLAPSLRRRKPVSQ